jgi:OmpA-OmpF porin, OOP family
MDTTSLNKEACIMRKLVTLTAALSLAAASATALADGSAFVNANAGYSAYNINQVQDSFSLPSADTHLRKGDPAGALRVGYRWNSIVDYGVEAGYGYLGQARQNSVADPYAHRITQKNRGFLLGGNLNYNITEHWYASARAGWFRGRNTYAGALYSPTSVERLRATDTNTGEYFGVGAGYNFNRYFSVGLAYDTYHTPASAMRSSNAYLNGFGVRGTRAGMYSLQGEYRF